MSSPEHPHSDPFRSKLVKSHFDERTDRKGKIHVLEDDSSVVVRTPYFSEDQDPLQLPHISENLDWQIQQSRTAKVLFDKLASYGIAVPPFNFVTGEHEGRPVVFTVTKKIEGHKLDTDFILQAKNENFINALEGLFESLVNYYLDKIENEELYLNDISNVVGILSQYRWGHQEGEPTDKIYLVDLDPFFTHFIPYPIGDKQQSHLGIVIQCLTAQLEGLDRSQVFLPRARRAVLKLYPHLLPSEEYYLSSTYGHIMSREGLQRGLS